MADDHPVVREGLCELLRSAGRFNVVGQVGDGRAAVAMAKAQRPDVIILDISMPVLNGLDAMRQILAHQPTAKVLIVSAHSDEDYIKFAMEAGAAGLVQKHLAADRLAKTITEVASGKAIFRLVGARSRMRSSSTIERRRCG